MTRINCVPVDELANQHLVAEYREMLRFRHAHPRSKMIVPPTYRLGTGHCTFFYDKGGYLAKRHAELRAEMERRGYAVNYELDLSSWPQSAMNDWTPTPEALAINRQRIAERLGQ